MNNILNSMSVRISTTKQIWDNLEKNPAPGDASDAEIDHPRQT